MSKRAALLILFLVLLIYPVVSIFLLEQVIEINGDSLRAQNKLIDYQVSIWITWVLMMGMAVYYKWERSNNIFFYLTYGFLAAAFAIFGYYTQTVVNVFDLPSRFKDGYTHGVFAALQNIAVSGILTALLQLAVWWFTRRWHRR